MCEKCEFLSIGPLLKAPELLTGSLMKSVILMSLFSYYCVETEIFDFVQLKCPPKQKTYMQQLELNAAKIVFQTVVLGGTTSFSSTCTLLFLKDVKQHSLPVVIQRKSKCVFCFLAVCLDSFRFEICFITLN